MLVDESAGLSTVEDYSIGLSDPLSPVDFGDIQAMDVIGYDGTLISDRSIDGGRGDLGHGVDEDDRRITLQDLLGLVVAVPIKGLISEI